MTNNLTFAQYQEAAYRTSMHFRDPSRMMAYGALGLAGEAGETAEIVKKVAFHGHELDEELLKKELGDVMWYIAFLCQFFGFTMEEVAQRNIDKLLARYPLGFNYADSINRDEAKE